MRRCGNCGQTGHNRRTCNGSGSGGGGGGFYGGGGGMQPRQPRRQDVRRAAVKTLFNCSGGRNGNSHTLYMLVSDSAIAVIVPRSTVQRGGGAKTYYCPTHGCRITKA